MLQFMGLQRARHDWETELNWWHTIGSCLFEISVFEMDTLALSSQKLNVKHLHYTYRTTWKNMWLYQLSRMHLWLVLIPAVPFRAHPWQISAPREIHGNSHSSTINYCPGVGTTQNIHTKIHTLWTIFTVKCGIQQLHTKQHGCIANIMICQWVKSLWLCNPMVCSPPGSSIHGIFQARVLEWVAISFSRESSWPRDQTHRLNHQGNLMCQSSQKNICSVWLLI